MTPAHARAAEIAATGILLVASDFDGTLAPIAPDPGSAAPVPGSLRALAALAALPHTHVAVISGRARAELMRLVGDHSVAHLIGSHGAETADHAPPITPERTALLDRLARDAGAIAASHPGTLVERKPAAVALHYRRAAEPTAAEAVQALLAGPGALPGVHPRHGSMVVELCLDDASKGSALSALRRRLGASAVVFIGDDLTDEDAFGALGASDLAVKVGPGPSRAPYRLDHTGDVRNLLETLLDYRRDRLSSAPHHPIEDLSLLSDQRTVAIVTGDARVCWLCMPRIDSPALFAELLDTPAAGYFSVAPADGARALDQRYADDSLVLVTRFAGFTVTDYFDCSAGRPYQRAGRTDLVRVIQGAGPVRVEFNPRMDFGRTATRMVLRDSGIEIEAPDPVVLHAPDVPWRLRDDGPHHAAIAEFDLPLRPVILEMRYGSGSLRPSPVPEPDRRRHTQRFWHGWASTLQLPSVAPDAVRRSALVLKALCHGPTGAIAAAGTTSLPEWIGGVRNWDYRFCWPRDAAYAAAALVRLGNTGPAMKFLDWLVSVVNDLDAPERLRPVYSVSGAQLGPEAEIGDLHGYGASRPVRIGNAAAQQVQLDVFGPIVHLVSMLIERGAPVTPEYWRLVVAMVGAVAARWKEPDNGIWELRMPRRHHVHSKTMCWLTIDRALAIADQYLGRPRHDWETLRDRIREEVLARGYHPEIGAFTTAYEDPNLDAAALHVGLCGLIAPTDPRFVATVEAVDARLRTGPTVKRYLMDDGLPGPEGGFHICTSWLVQALALIGQRQRARDLFDRMAALVNRNGLLSEEFDPVASRALGNHPQAYSHIGLIDAAVLLSTP